MIKTEKIAKDNTIEEVENLDISATSELRHYFSHIVQLNDDEISNTQKRYTKNQTLSYERSLYGKLYLSYNKTTKKLMPYNDEDFDSILKVEINRNLKAWVNKVISITDENKDVVLDELWSMLLDKFKTLAVGKIKNNSIKKLDAIALNESSLNVLESLLKKEIDISDLEAAPLERLVSDVSSFLSERRKFFRTKYPEGLRLVALLAPKLGDDVIRSINSDHKLYLLPYIEGNIKDNIKKYYDFNFSIEDVGERYEPAYDKSRALLPISLFYSNSEKLDFIYSKIKKETYGKSHQEIKKEICKFVLAMSTYERFGIDSIAGIYIKEAINCRFMVYNLEKRLGL